MKKIVITLSITISMMTMIANAQRNDLQYQEPQQNNDLEFNRFYLNLYNRLDDIKTNIHKDRKIKKEFEELNDISIANKPKTKLIRAIDFIAVHHNIPLTILLPVDANVTYVSTYPKTVSVSFDKNNIDVIPTRNFLKSTLIIKYKIDGQMKAMSIILDRYEQSDDKLQTIFPIVEYVDIKPLDDIDVIKKYVKLKGKYPKNNDSIVIGKVVYRFVEDKVNGKIRLKGHKFRIETNYNNN